MKKYVIPGIPAPQGSKVRTRFGMREDNPATRPWRNTVAAVAATAAGEPLAGPLELRVHFFFPRPKAHYRANGTLKDSAATYKTSKPDVDKLVRAVCDGLTGYAFQDDSQVVSLHAVKLYGHPRATVWVQPAGLIGEVTIQEDAA